MDGTGGWRMLIISLVPGGRGWDRLAGWGGYGGGGGVERDKVTGGKGRDSIHLPRAVLHSC